MKRRVKDGTIKFKVGFVEKLKSFVVWGVAITLILWLAVAAQVKELVSEQVIFYSAILLVCYLWSEAMFRRAPNTYDNPFRRVITFVTVGAILTLAVVALFYLYENPEMIQKIKGGG